MFRGSCLCGAIQYEFDGEPGPIGVCHCSRCQKATGTAFNAIVPIDAATFRLTAGGDHLKRFESSPGVNRFFCGTCGSPLYSRRDALPDMLRIRIGTLDTPPPGKPAMHIFVNAKASWYDISDGAPQYAERPPH
jgi:hypothetical protein